MRSLSRRSSSARLDLKLCFPPFRPIVLFLSPTGPFVCVAVLPLPIDSFNNSTALQNTLLHTHSAKSFRNARASERVSKENRQVHSCRSGMRTHVVTRPLPYAQWDLVHCRVSLGAFVKACHNEVHFLPCKLLRYDSSTHTRTHTRITFAHRILFHFPRHCSAAVRAFCSTL